MSQAHEVAAIRTKVPGAGSFVPVGALTQSGAGQQRVQPPNPRRQCSGVDRRKAPYAPGGVQIFDRALARSASSAA
jgi:hypothetical protein